MPSRTDPSAYDRFAWFYDRYWGSGPMSFTARALPIVERFILSTLQPGARILDLCCGSGQLADELTTRGYHITGVDGSAHLLAYARQHAPKTEFVHADARAFTLAQVYDAAVSLYDSLNHVLELDGLRAVFRNVAAALKPDASFLFDLNMEEGFRTRWRGAFGLAESDHALINQSSYAPDTRLAQTTATMFRLEGKSWRRSDVTLYQRCYPEDEVREALTTSEFNKIQTFDAEKDLGMQRQTGRAFFLAIRGGV